jgi:hypothetical protein
MVRVDKCNTKNRVPALVVAILAMACEERHMRAVACHRDIRHAAACRKLGAHTLKYIRTQGLRRHVLRSERLQGDLLELLQPELHRLLADARSISRSLGAAADGEHVQTSAQLESDARRITPRTARARSEGAARLLEVLRDHRKCSLVHAKVLSVSLVVVIVGVHCVAVHRGTLPPFPRPADDTPEPLLLLQRRLSRLAQESFSKQQHCLLAPPLGPECKCT